MGGENRGRVGEEKGELEGGYGHSGKTSGTGHILLPKVRSLARG